MGLDYLPSVLKGAWLTLEVSTAALCVAVALGLLGASARLSRHRLPRWVAGAYTSVIRGVPDLVLMLLIFFGGQMLLNDVTERFTLDPIDLDAFLAGSLTLGLIFGAYFTETFRGAFLAVPPGQIEAGIACGMTRAQVFRRILFPQMMRFAIVPAGNNWQVLLKSTALVSMIGLQDMTWLADQAGRSVHRPFLYYLVVALIYLAFNDVSARGLRVLERRYTAGVRAVRP
jgi:histidine transport system permease protein